MHLSHAAIGSDAAPSADWLLEHATDCFVAMDRDLRITFANKAAAEVAGFVREEMVGKTHWDLWPQSRGTVLEDGYLRAIGSGTPQHFEYYRHSDGSERWLEVHVYPHPHGLWVVFRDIGERKRWERALREGERRLRILNEAGRVLGSTLDLRDVYRKLRQLVSSSMPCDGLVVSTLTPEAATIHCEYCFADGIEIDPGELPPVDYTPGRGMQSRVIESGQAMVFNDVGAQIREAGTKYVVANQSGVSEAEENAPTKSAVMVPILLEGKVTGVVQVMTDRRRAYTDDDRELLEGIVLQMAAAVRNARLYERALHEVEVRKQAEERLELALKSGRIAAYEQDLNQRYTWVRNPLAERRAEDIVGKTPDDIAKPEVAAVVNEQKQRVMRTGQGVSFEMTQDLDMGRLVTRHRVEPLRNREGEIVGFNGVIVDITELREAEDALRESHAQLERRVDERTAELRAAVSELEGFTYSISHDLRAPLRAIVGTSAILQEDHGAELSDDARDLLRRQSLAARKMGVLIDDLLKLSRVTRHPIVPEEIDLSELAASVAQELGESERIVVTPGLRTVGDPTLIRFVLMNLFENGLKFSPNGSRVEFGREGDALYVRDRGVGFDMEYADRIFLPFERLVRDDQFPGTGIGLANVKRIIDRHQGRIWAESSPGEGATFWFELALGR